MARSKTTSKMVMPLDSIKSKAKGATTTKKKRKRKKKKSTKKN
jgi:hypothetical protein